MNLTLVEKKDEAKGTKSFFWQPDSKIDYLPGQYYYYTLLKPNFNDPRGNTRHFTISSSPTEGPLLRLTTRIRDESGYKMTLDSLKIGEIILGDGPSGTYILDEHEKGQHVLLAGGIGVTPFRSFIKYNIDKKLTDIKIHLIYTCSIPEEIAFRKELESWSQEYENIQVDITISRPEESKEKWTGLKGRIDEKMIQKLTRNYKNPTFWVCGPPPMVDAMEKTLGVLKVTSNNLRSEKFTGY